MLFKMYPLDYQLKSGEKYKQRVSLKLKKDKYSAFLRLIPMRIRFRAYFGRVAKLNIVCAKRTSCAKSDAEMVLGSFVGLLV